MLEVGSKLYLYTARDGRFTCHEGVVITGRHYHYPSTRYVKFDDGHSKEFIPKEHEIGKLMGARSRLWLTERDDEFARKLFLDCERVKLEELERHVTRKKNLIKVLEEGVCE